MIRTDDELEQAVRRVSDDLADIQNYLGQENHPRAKIRFPRGYLREAVGFRRELWYIENDILKRNLAYAHLMSDVFRWLLNRTDLSWSAQEMVIKEGVCLSASICESLTKEVAVEDRICGKKTGFKTRCQKLRDSGIVTDDTCSELEWLWDTRQAEHIFLVPDREHEMYDLSHYNRGVRALRSLKDDLDAYYTPPF